MKSLKYFDIDIRYINNSILFGMFINLVIFIVNQCLTLKGIWLNFICIVAYLIGYMFTLRGLTQASGKKIPYKHAPKLLSAENIQINPKDELKFKLKKFKEFVSESRVVLEHLSKSKEPEDINIYYELKSDFSVLINIINKEDNIDNINNLNNINNINK